MPTQYRFCSNCKRRLSRRSRPTCHSCRKAGIPLAKSVPPRTRTDYLLFFEGDRGNRGIPQPYNYYPRAPHSPTSAQPGSESKISVLSERVSLGRSLWHPEDTGRIDVDRFEGVLS